MTMQHTHPSQLAATGRGLVVGGLIALLCRLAGYVALFATSRHDIGFASGLVAPTTVATGRFKRRRMRIAPWRRSA